MRNVISLRPRLAAAAHMLGKAPTVWDVGCDHGYLAASLLSSGAAGSVIATDISPASVKKTERLASELGLTDRIAVFEADGLSGPAPAGEYKLALCGMGGELIAQIFEAGLDTARGAELIVMQPMRGEEELRRWLYENGFGITDERAVEDDGRFYQLIAAKYGKSNEIPDWFPKDYFRFGWVMCSHPDEALAGLIKKYRAAYASRLRSAEKKGRSPAKLNDELRAVDTIIDYLASVGAWPRG